MSVHGSCSTSAALAIRKVLPVELCIMSILILLYQGYFFSYISILRAEYSVLLFSSTPGISLSFILLYSDAPITPGCMMSQLTNVDTVCPSSAG